MVNDAFSAARWDHWLLLVSFVSLASYGLWLSFQWNRSRRSHRQQRRLNRQRMSPLSQQGARKPAKKRQDSLRRLRIRN